MSARSAFRYFFCLILSFRIAAVPWIFWSGLAFAQTGVSISEEGQRSMRAQSLVKAQQPEMTFEVSRQTGTDGGPGIEANGRITALSVERLKSALDTTEATRRAVSFISINSDGGSLGSAIRMGELLRKKKIETRVEVSNICYSACAIMFLGGNFRSIDNTWNFPEVKDTQDVLGFHSFSISRSGIAGFSAEELSELTDDVSKETQTTSGILAAYMNAMNVSPELIRLSATYGRNRYLFPPMAQLAALGVITRDIKGEEFRLVPDGIRVNAVSTDGQSQLLLTCETEGLQQPRPILILSTRVWRPNVNYTLQREKITKASTILAATALPWSSGDIEQQAFEAKEQVLLGQNNREFSWLAFDKNRDASEEEYRRNLYPGDKVTQQNTRFFATAEEFNIVYTMRPIDVLYFKSFNRVMLHVMQRNFVFGGWFFSAENTIQGRENISFVLRECTP
jgi:hypothetical protein